MGIISSPPLSKSARKLPLRSDETSLFVSNEISTICSSEKHGWSDIFAVQTLETPHESLHKAVPYFWLSMGLNDTHVGRVINGREEYTLLPAFSVSIAPPGTPVKCCIVDNTEAVHVFIKPDLLNQVASEILPVGSENISLKSIFGEESASLGWLLRSIKKSLNEPVELSKLKIDYLARALCADLLSKYGDDTPLLDSNNGSSGLSMRQIGRITEYITQNLHLNIQVQALESIVGLRRTTFTSRFNNSLRMTPYQYIMKLRIEKAASLLRLTENAPAEIAFLCGFADQAHLASAFKRAMGVTPAVYRRSYL